MIYESRSAIARKKISNKENYYDVLEIKIERVFVTDIFNDTYNYKLIDGNGKSIAVPIYLVSSYP